MTADEQGDIGLRELQAKVDLWITTVGVRYFSPLTNMAILAEETGGGGPYSCPHRWRTVMETGRKRVAGR